MEYGKDECGQKMGSCETIEIVLPLILCWKKTYGTDLFQKRRVWIK